MMGPLQKSFRKRLNKIGTGTRGAYDRFGPKRIPKVSPSIPSSRTGLRPAGQGRKQSKQEFQPIVGSGATPQAGRPDQGGWRALPEEPARSAGREAEIQRLIDMYGPDWRERLGEAGPRVETKQATGRPGLYAPRGTEPRMTQEQRAAERRHAIRTSGYSRKQIPGTESMSPPVGKAVRKHKTGGTHSHRAGFGGGVRWHGTKPPGDLSSYRPAKGRGGKQRHMVQVPAGQQRKARPVYTPTYVRPRTNAVGEMQRAFRKRWMGKHQTGVWHPHGGKGEHMGYWSGPQRQSPYEQARQQKKHATKTPHTHATPPPAGQMGHERWTGAQHRAHAGGAAASQQFVDRRPPKLPQRKTPGLENAMIKAVRLAMKAVMPPPQTPQDAAVKKPAQRFR